MKSIFKKIISIATLSFLTLGYPDSSVYAQNDSQSPIHELPRADQCSVITMHIRQLVSSLKKVVKEISLLESPLESAAGDKEHAKQQSNENEQRLELLHESASSLQKQIDMQEQQLENCVHRTITPPQ